MPLGSVKHSIATYTAAYILQTQKHWQKVMENEIHKTISLYSVIDISYPGGHLNSSSSLQQDVTAGSSWLQNGTHWS